MVKFGNQGSLRQYLIRTTSVSMVLKIGHTAIILLLAIVLARVLGVENFGVYAFCYSIVQILTVPAMLGGQQLLVREVAAYRARGEYHFLRGLILRFRWSSFFVSVLLAMIAAAIGYGVYKGSPMLFPFLMAAALIPLNTILHLQSAVLQGFRHVLLGQMSLTLRLGLVILLMGAVYLFTAQNQSAEAALSAQLASTLALVLAVMFILHRIFPQEMKGIQPAYETARWIKSMLPFVFVGSMQIVNMDISVVLLGALKTPTDVGFFRVAQRGAMLIPFGLQAVNMVIAPTVSELFAKGEKKRLQRIISKSILGVVAFALPMAIVLIFGGKWLIPFAFGPEFLPAYTPLVILCLGQLVNAGIGSVGLILNMIGLERLTARGVGIAALSNILLNLALIPNFGATGAAMATTISLVIWNILLFVWLYKETGIISAVRWTAN